MVNLVVNDMAASLGFYRRLGIPVPAGEDAAGAHVQLRMPSGFSLELDTTESARLWHAAWRADPAGVSVIVGLLAAQPGCRRPAVCGADLGWLRGPPAAVRRLLGARYAIVADPDGNDVGLMSPIDETRRTWPPEQFPHP